MTKNAWRAEPLVGDVTVTEAEFKLEKDKSTCSASFFSSASIDSSSSEQDRLIPPLRFSIPFFVAIAPLALPGTQASLQSSL